MPLDENGNEILDLTPLNVNGFEMVPDPDLWGPIEVHTQRTGRALRNPYTNVRQYLDGVQPYTVVDANAPAAVVENPYEQNQNDFIEYIEDISDISIMQTNSNKKTRPKKTRCSFCGALYEKITTVSNKALCDECLGRYTKVCSGGCETRLIHNDYTDTGSRHIQVRTTYNPEWKAIVNAGGDPFGTEWYCTKCSAKDSIAALLATIWTCGHCGQMHIKHEYPFKGANGRIKCGPCYSDFMVRAKTELAWNANILDYLMPFKPPASKLQFGIELEVQVAHTVNINRKIEMIRGLLPDFVICKHDGSLLKREGWLGFEIVSVPATVEEHKQQWPKLLDTKHGLYSWKTGDCGMHVHITKAALTNLQIGRMVSFVNSPDNGALIMLVAGRHSTVYSTILDKKITDGCTVIRDRYENRLVAGPAHQTGDHNFDRRQAVNLINPNTVEIRIFRGNMRPESFFKNLEFVEALVAFCRDASNSGLTTKEFLKFVDANRKHYPYLVRFFIAKDYLKEIIRPSWNSMPKLEEAIKRRKEAIERNKSFTFVNE